MKNKKTLLALAFSASLFSATNAHAVLTLTLDGQGVYDSDLNITWLQNASLAATETFGVSGISASGTMNWNTAQRWIAGMNAYNNGTGWLGYNDWRLPTTLQPDASCNGQSGSVFSWGYNCTGSEMGHLFYNELGGSLTSSDPDLALFQNVQPRSYWSGTEYTDYSLHIVSAWYFSTGTGFQHRVSKDGDSPAWAVRDGDSPVVTSPVSEPETYAMLLAGLGLLAFTAKRKKQSV